MYLGGNRRLVPLTKVPLKTKHKFKVPESKTN